MLGSDAMNFDAAVIFHQIKFSQTLKIHENVDPSTMKKFSIYQKMVVDPTQTIDDEKKRVEHICEKCERRK